MQCVCACRDVDLREGRRGESAGETQRALGTVLRGAPSSRCHALLRRGGVSLGRVPQRGSLPSSADNSKRPVRWSSPETTASSRAAKRLTRCAAVTRRTPRPLLQCIPPCSAPPHCIPQCSAPAAGLTTSRVEQLRLASLRSATSRAASRRLIPCRNASSHLASFRSATSRAASRRLIPCRNAPPHLAHSVPQWPAPFSLRSVRGKTRRAAVECSRDDGASFSARRAPPSRRWRSCSRTCR
jgi:hypothetical protein